MSTAPNVTTERDRLALIRAALPTSALHCRREVRAALASAAEVLHLAVIFGALPIADAAKASALSFALYARALSDAGTFASDGAALRTHGAILAFATSYVDSPAERFVRLWYLAWSAYEHRAEDDAFAQSQPKYTRQIRALGDGDRTGRAAAHFLLALDALDEVVGEGAAWGFARDVILEQHRAEHDLPTRSARSEATSPARMAA